MYFILADQVHKVEVLSTRKYKYHNDTFIFCDIDVEGVLLDVQKDELYENKEDAVCKLKGVLSDKKDNLLAELTVVEDNLNLLSKEE